MRLSPWHDVVGGLAAAAAAAATDRRALLAGVAVGALWEVPFHVLKRSAAPVFVDVQPWPLPERTQPAVHALWDGALLVAGLALARALEERVPQVVTVTAWGAGQELVAELVGNGRVWQWQERWWNPALFRRGDVAYTLLPQLVWTVAPALHLALVRRLATGARSVAGSDA